ncbi:MAG TPA: response regulator, partial [Verrucomicrobiae bacterium]
FLELFGDLCTEYSKGAWNVFKANCADAALVHLKNTPMDLAVLDVNMPMLDGLQLLGIINRRYPGLKVVIMTGAATDAKRADSLAKGAELFLEKPVTDDGIRSIFSVLNEMLSWHREGFTGALHRVTLQEIIQVQCIGRYSSVLEVRNPQMSGQIFIDAGVVVHAIAGSIAGRPAFYQLLSLRGGYFQVTPFKAPPMRSIDTPWENLLMDAALAVDEESMAKPNGDALSDFQR